MSKKKDEPRLVSRRDTLKLATAVSALGVGLGATFGASDAEAATPGAIHMLKLDALKLDKLVLSLHKGEASSQPLKVVDVTSLLLKNQKLAPDTYFLKLTALKEGAVVVTAVDQFSLGGPCLASSSSRRIGDRASSHGARLRRSARRLRRLLLSRVPAPRST